MEIPFITTEQMREVDRLMVEEFGISLPQMMENAGRNLARLGSDLFLDGEPRGKRVAVLCGPGGNGGGGMVCARRLLTWGADVIVWLARPTPAHTGVPASQLSILENMDACVRVGARGARVEGDLIVDSLLGYSLRGAPTGAAAALIHAANGGRAPVLALDVPSGVDSATGEVFDPAVKADATMTLALPKTGLRERLARACVGDLYLADISVPPRLYSMPGLDVEVGPLFHEAETLRIW